MNKEKARIMLKAVLVASLVCHLMVNITRPLLALFASSLGAGTFMIGLVASCFALMPLLLAMRLGRLADQFGYRLPAILGVSGVTLGLAFPFVMPTLGGLIISQLIVGVGHTMAVVTLQNLIGSNSSKQSRDQRFGWFAMTASAGALIGPVMGGYISQYFSYPIAFLCASLIGLLAIAMASVLPPGVRGEPRKSERTNSFELLKIPALRRAIASSALVLYSRDIFIIYFPLFGTVLGLSMSTIGWIIAAQAFALVIVRLCLGKLTKAFSRTHILAISITLAGIAFALIPLTDKVLVLGLLSVLMGVGLGCGQPLSMSTTFNASPVGRTGEAMGLRMAGNRLCQLLAPLFFGALGAWAGLLAVFYISGGFLVCGAFLSSEPKRKLGDR